ncbi:hypothetical protein MBAV_004932 [Candidatus Magnetobacterium bavaricum]|uniref:Uncharacterized protein n=1 Tax=Candidatus Magnetobacterium bavaricum TaxID=29290 RepID=A0A0F3GQF0_9BACT|nr:hypothetical protein MBAV_004932 [Candidatus Magnetobacterium bavaricum]
MIEGKQYGCGLRHRYVALLTGISVRKGDLAAVVDDYLHPAIAIPPGQLDRVSQARLIPDDDPVNDHLVGVVTVGDVKDVPYLTGDVEPHKPLLPDRGKWLLRGVCDHGPGVGVGLNEPAQRHSRRPLLDLPATLWAEWRGDARKHHPHQVVYLRDGAHGRAGTLDGVALFQGDGRTDVAYLIDVGAVELFQEQLGVARQRLDESPLPLGKDGVKGQRRLPRPRYPRYGDHLVVRKPQRYVPEVVLPHTLYLKPINIHKYLSIIGAKRKKKTRRAALPFFTAPGHTWLLDLPRKGRGGAPPPQRSPLDPIFSILILLTIFLFNYL